MNDNDILDKYWYHFIHLYGTEDRKLLLMIVKTFRKGHNKRNVSNINNEKPKKTKSIFDFLKRKTEDKKQKYIIC